MEKVNSSLWRYFKFFQAVPRNLKFSVTRKGIHGDPDIFVSTIHEKPNQQNNEWYARSFGSDILHVHSQKTGWFYIGILGFQETHFELMVVSEASM